MHRELIVLLARVKITPHISLKFMFCQKIVNKFENRISKEIKVLLQKRKRDDSITTEGLLGVSQLISDGTGSAREMSVCLRHLPSLTIELSKYIIKKAAKHFQKISYLLSINYFENFKLIYLNAISNIQMDIEI